MTPYRICANFDFLFALFALFADEQTGENGWGRY
jgi:hypothetical protein